LTVRIVTDSTADLPPEVARELGIAVIPLSVIFGDEVLKEGVEITPDRFYERLAHSKTLPTTSAPSVGDFLSVYEPLLADKKTEILSIHISSRLSATYSNACQAAERLKGRGRIDVIDSQSVSFGLIFMSKAAALAARLGAKLDEIRALVLGMMPRVRIIVVLDTLEYVRRGGRIGRARAFLGAVLRVKPIISLREGEVHPEERVRTKAMALERIYQAATTAQRVQEVCLGYSTNPQEAELLKERIEAALPAVPVGLIRVGLVLGVHLGPGVFGVGILEGVE